MSLTVPWQYMPSLRDFQAQTQTVYDGIFDMPSKLTVI